MMSAVTSSTANPRLPPATRRIAWIVSAVFFMEQLDATIIAPALHTMAVDLGTDAITLSSAITAYLMGQTVLIPISGRLAERFGDKALFSLAIVLFMLASIACGLAPNAGTLIALRFIQGLAGALMSPVGRLIVLRSAAKHELVEAMALVIMLAMIAPICGPFLGGVIATYAGWRFIFWANLPICLVTLLLVCRFLPSTPGVGDVRFDTRGSVLTGLGFAGVVYGLVALGEHNTHAGHVTWSIAALVSGVGLLAVYALYARRVSAPVLSVALLQLRSFRESMLGGSVFRIAVGGLPFLLPLTLQAAYGYSLLQASMVSLVPALGGFLMKFFSTRLLRRLGYRRGLSLHGALAGVCLGLVGLLDPRQALIVYVLALFGFGWGRSLNMNAYGTLAYADVDKSRMPSATSFFLAIQNLTTALGVAIAAVLLESLSRISGISLLQSHYLTYVVLAVLAGISAVMCLFMPATTGHSLLAGKAKT